MAGTKDLEAQADILAQMQAAMGGLSDSMGSLNEGANNFTDAMSSIVDMLPGIGEGSQNMSELAANAGDATEETTNMSSAMEKLIGKQKDSAAAVGDGTKKLKKYAAAGAGLAIVGSIFTNMVGMIKSVGSLLSGIVTTSTNMIKSVWDAYAATWDALGAMSKEMYKEGLKIAKAYNEVRATFGDLSTGSGAAVVGMFNDIRGSGDFANQTGMSLFHTFGDMAAQLKIFNAIAKEGGEVFRRSAENWKNAGFEALMMNKAFSVGGKAMALMGEDAVRAGGSAKEATESYAKMAVGLKKGFGVELKSLGKNFTALKEDVKAFGHMSQKELVATAGYASALGVEVKSLKGMFDSFSNFEDAAAGAAKLGEAFGMNLDTMALMNAESPAEQMDQMRNAFMETGKSVDDLSRHQRAYLAETMSVDPSDLTAMFDPNNADISYDDMIAAADDAEKELSPAEAMREAAKEISKAFEQLTVQSNTFFGHFKEGFLSGLKMTKPFRQFFQALHKSMREVHQIGRDLAQQLFGKGGVFSSDAMGFVGKWKAYLSEIVKWFKKLSGFIVDFAKDLQGGGDPSAAIQTFLDGIFASVSDFFSSDAVVEWNKMLAGFMQTAAKMFEKLAVGLIHWVADKIKNIAISWSDDTGVMGAWGEAFMALWESLKVVAVELWKILGPPILDGLNKLWDWLKPHLFTALKVMFVIAITKALISAAAVALAGAVLKGILGGMMGAVKKATTALGPAAPSVGPVESMMETAKKLGSTVVAWPMAIFNAGMLTLFILGGFLLTLGAFVLLYKVISKMDVGMALTTAAVLVALAVAFYAMSKAVAALSKILPPQLIAAAAGAGLVALAMLGMGLIAVAIIEMIKMSTPMPKIGDIGMFFGIMGVTLIAGALALYLATIAAKFAKPQTLLGLGLLGLAMIGLGKVAQTIAEMFGSINPSVLKQVGPIMTAMAILMTVVMLALPVAGLLGVMLMAWPFGTAGIAIIAAGFAVLGSLAVHMVNGLMPAIEKIGQIKVKDPASVEQITKALAAIIIAMSSFMAQVANTMNAAKPTKGSGDTMAGNLKAMEGTVGAVLTPMMDIINVLVDLVSSANIKPENLKALEVIGKIMGSLADLSSSITPSPEHLKMIKKSANWWNGKKNTKILTAMNAAMDKQRDFIISLMVTAGVVIIAMLNAASKVKGPGAAQALEATAKILTVVVDIAANMTPSEEQMKMFQKAASGGKKGRRTMAMMNKHMNMMQESIGPMITALGGAAVLIMQAMTPMIKEIGTMKVDPKVMEAVAGIIASVMGAVGSMGAMIGPAMSAMAGAATDDKNMWGQVTKTGAKKMEDMMTSFGTMVTTIGSAMTSMLPEMSSFIQTIMSIASTIRDPKGMAKRMEVVVSAMSIIGTMIGTLGTVMNLMKDLGASGEGWHAYLGFMFGGSGYGEGVLPLIFKTAGEGIQKLMGHVMTATKDIADPKTMKIKMEIVALAMKAAAGAMKMMGDVMKMMGDLGASGTGWTAYLNFMFGGPGFGEGVMITMMRKSGDGIQLLMQYVHIAVGNIKNPAQIKSRMEIVIMALDVAAKAMGMLGNVMNLMKGLGATGSGWNAYLGFMFGGPGYGEGLMISIMRSAGDGLKEFMPMVTDVMSGMKERPSVMKAKMEVIVLALEAVGAMSNAIKNVTNLMGGGAGIMQGKSLDILFHNLKAIMPVIVDNMSTLVNGIIKIVKPEDGSKISAIYKYRHTIKELPNIFDAITAFAASLQALKGVGGGDIASIKPLIIAFGAVFNDPVAIESLRGALGNIANLPVYTYKGTAKAVKSAATMIDTSLTALSQALQSWNAGQSSGGDWRTIRNIHGMIAGGTVEGLAYGPGLKGFMEMVKTVATPDVSKLGTAVNAIGFLVADDLVWLSKTLGKWKDGSADGGWRDISNVYGLISGGDADGYQSGVTFGPGIRGFLEMLGSFPAVSLGGIMSGVIGIGIFLEKALIPMGKSLSKATKLFGVKEGTKWWQKDVAGGGTMDVESLADGMRLIMGGFAKFDQLVGVAPSDLDGAVLTLNAYANKFMAISTSLDRMRFALYQTVKFAKLKVTPDVVVQQAAAKIDELSKAFATLDELVVDSTMAKVAAGLQGVGELKVNHKGLAINVKINVIVDSKQLAASLNPEDGAYFIINEDREVPVSAAEFLG